MQKYLNCIGQIWLSILQIRVLSSDCPGHLSKVTAARCWQSWDLNLGSLVSACTLQQAIMYPLADTCQLSYLFFSFQYIQIHKIYLKVWILLLWRNSWEDHLSRSASNSSVFSLLTNFQPLLINESNLLQAAWSICIFMANYH